jgi:hypothetical protein
MKNKDIKNILWFFFGILLGTFGNAIGGVIGDVVTLFGGIMAIYALVEFFKKPKNQPPTTS